MAEPFLRGTTWYARVKDSRGGWKNLALDTAKTKAEAKRLQRELEWKAERRRLGLEALPQKTTMTVAELATWWLDDRCPKRSLRSEKSRLTRHVIETKLGKLSLAELDAPAIENHLALLERAGASPASVNHIRKMLHTIISKATKAGHWFGANPAKDVERRKVVKRIYETLAAEEVPTLLREVPPQWRCLFATAAYLGLRKGELFALQKQDVDLKDGTIIVRRSHEYDSTKGGHEDRLPIPAPLRPYLKAALKISTSPYVFPDENGERRSEHAKPDLVLKHALARAGLVLGYDHTCRRCKANKKRYVERHEDAEPRQCPNCSMRLWPKAIPRPLRFQDLRHSTATILLRAGVDMHRVQRILRHADVRLTVETYGHLVVEDLRDAVDCVAPKKKADFAAGLLHDPKNRAHGENEQRKFLNEKEGLKWREQLDSNQRPLASEANALSS